MYKIFSKRIATQLIARGNELVSTETNLKNRRLIVFLFKDTEKLKADLTELSK